MKTTIKKKLFFMDNSQWGWEECELESDKVDIGILLLIDVQRKMKKLKRNKENGFFFDTTQFCFATKDDQPVRRFIGSSASKTEHFSIYMFLIHHWKKSERKGEKGKIKRVIIYAY